ncbi:unnamed protein product [Trichobilharzia szidati]|nr:unnamed protein product [Trichobilharzia szidati]
MFNDNIHTHHNYNSRLHHRLKIMPKLYNKTNLSFVSGHASTAAAGVFFSVIYLQARLQLPPLPLFRPFIQYALIASLIYVCTTRVTDHYHHATDVLAGLILGFLTSVFAVATVTSATVQPII